MPFSIAFENLENIRNWLEAKNTTFRNSLVQKQEKKTDVRANIKDTVAGLDADSIAQIQIVFFKQFS